MRSGLRVARADHLLVRAAEFGIVATNLPAARLPGSTAALEALRPALFHLWAAEQYRRKIAGG